MVRPCAPHHYSPPRSFCCSGFSLPQTTAGRYSRHWSPAGAGRQVPTFRTGARTELAPPSCRAPPGQSAGSRQAHPGTSCRPRFWCLLCSFDTSSVVRFRSPSRLTPAALTARLFPRRSPPRLLTAAARGGLQPSPTGRLRRATRPTVRLLHLRYSSAFRLLRPSTSSLLQHPWHTQDRAPPLELHRPQLARATARLTPSGRLANRLDDVDRRPEGLRRTRRK